MAAIHIRTTLTSDTPHLPELAPLIGRRVEIVVREEGSAAAPTPWVLPTPAQIAAGQQAAKELRESGFDWEFYADYQATQKRLAAEKQARRTAEGDEA
jgi:hypothetical protein